MTGINRAPNQGTTGTMWINDGDIRKCVLQTETIPDGWSHGMRLKSKDGASPHSFTGKRIYTNGIEDRYFLPGYEPIGWVRG